MVRQVLDSNRGDAHKIAFLRKALIECVWPKEFLSLIATAGLSFQQLYAELEITAQLERETVDAACLKTVSRPLSVDTLATTNFMGQAKNARGKRNFKRNFSVKKRSCVNCGSDLHLVKYFPHPVNSSRAAASRIQQLRDAHTKNAVHIVLAHLCIELVDPTDDVKVDHLSEPNDLAIIE